MRKRIMNFIEGNFRKLKEKLLYVISEKHTLHKAEIIMLEQLPTGEFKEVKIGENLVLIGGLKGTCGLLYNVSPSFLIDSFEKELYMGAEEDLLPLLTVPEEGRTLPWCQGFNVFHDGSVGDGVKRYPRHKNGIDFDAMIPFRVIPEELNDYTAMKPLYLHHRKVMIEGRYYIEYYTKRFNITVKAVLKSGIEIPDYPSTNLNTDLDSRVIVEFPVSITKDELIEHFRLRNQDGAEAAGYSATSIMLGEPANIEIDGVSYKTMNNSVVFTRSNHLFVSHGEDAILTVKYRMLMV